MAGDALLLMDGVQHLNTDASAYYDVFISHRGPDTKSGFVSFLHKDLARVGLRAFLDGKSIDIGDNSWECIEYAIKSAPVAIVVFSKGFAQSEWCLKELHVMLHTSSVKVLPIFYKVRPSEVRFPESGQLKDGFEKLTRRHPKVVIDQWRANLEQASKIMGWEHSCVHERMEGDLVKEIIEKIFILANKPLPLDVGEYVFGVNEVAEHLIQTLDIKKKVMMLGLWGVGGIGKSTLAKELYNQLRRRFSSSCFIEDVTEKVIHGGVVEVQNCVMEELFSNEAMKIRNKSKGKAILEERLSKNRILMVLDDIRDNDEMAYWITRKMLGEGSMCIVTSRNRRIFEMAHSFDLSEEVYIHEVERLDIAHSYQVFVSHAFGGTFKVKLELESMVMNIIKACGGIPLVLRVCGALLKNEEDMKIWEAVMRKLDCGTIMDEDKIFECLCISYNSLDGQCQEIFLDIACALTGQYKDFTIHLWESYGWSATLGIRSLIEKALVVLDGKDCFSMHDHIRDMGREIERRGRGHKGIRRLWMPESSTKLKDEELPTSLQVLVINETYPHITLDVSRMKDLRILICNSTINVTSSFPKNLGLIQLEAITNPLLIPMQSKLVILKCTKYDLELLSDSIANASNLEVLDLNSSSKLSLLPHSLGTLKKLRLMRITNSKIQSLPQSFGEMSNLEVLDLRGCSQLSLLPHSFNSLKKLQDLKLSKSRIQSLPESFGELTNLEVLDLSGCSQLRLLPHSFGTLKKLRDIKLQYSGIQSFPESFTELSNLEVLNLRCSQLNLLPHTFGSLKKLRDIKLARSRIPSLPESFGELSNLEVLDLSCCSQCGLLPHSIGTLKKLRDIKLQFSGIQSLPESFGELSNLEVLDVRGCSQLSLLPHSFGNLKKLRDIKLQFLKIQSLPESFGELSNLEVLDLSYCAQLSLLPRSFGSLKKLREITLECSGIESLPESFGELLNLVQLNVMSCTKLITFPNSVRGLLNLRELVLTDSAVESLLRACGVLRRFEASDLSTKLGILSNWSGYLNNRMELDLACSEFTSLPACAEELKNLEVLSLSFCTNLTLLPSSFGGFQRLRDLKLDWSGIRCLPESFGELRNLEVLNLSACYALVFLPDSFGRLGNLRTLDMTDCHNLLELPESFGSLRKLRELNLRCAAKLTSLPASFGGLSNLEHLNLWRCEELAALPDSFGSLGNLRTLDLGSTGIKCLPASFQELVCLQDLNLSFCWSLKGVAQPLSHLTNLQKLDLHASLERLESVEHLMPSDCKVTVSSDW